MVGAVMDDPGDTSEKKATNKHHDMFECCNDLFVVYYFKPRRGLIVKTKHIERCTL